MATQEQYRIPPWSIETQNQDTPQTMLLHRIKNHIFRSKYKKYINFLCKDGDTFSCMILTDKNLYLKWKNWHTALSEKGLHITRKKKIYNLKSHFLKIIQEINFASPLLDNTFSQSDKKLILSQHNNEQSYDVAMNEYYYRYKYSKLSLLIDSMILIELGESLTEVYFENYNDLLKEYVQLDYSTIIISNNNKNIDDQIGFLTSIAISDGLSKLESLKEDIRTMENTILYLT